MVLFKQGKKSADDIVNQFTKLSAQETEEALKFLRDNGYDDVIQQMKATLVEDSFIKSLRPIEDLTLEAEKLSKATRAGGQARDSVQSNKFDPLVFKDILDPVRFMQNLNKSLKGTAGGGKGKAEILFSKEELKEIGDVLEYIRRANFSRVSPKASMLDIVLGFVNLPGLVARAGGMNYLSKLLLTKQGRDGLENFIALQTGEKQVKDLTKNMAANVVFFTESMMDYQTEFATTGSYYGQELLDDVKKKAEEFIPKIQAPESEFIEMEPDTQNSQSFNIPSPQVSRGQGVDVIPPLSSPINPQTVASLESIGMPLFNAKDGGLASLDTNKFKRPQVVA